jgi:hypothetical protein
MKLSANRKQGGEPSFSFETGTPYAVPSYGAPVKWGVHVKGEEERPGGVIIEALALPDGEAKEGLPLPGVSLELTVEEALALYESLGARLEEVKEYYRSFPNGTNSPKP